MARDDFPKPVIDALAKRVACRCSNSDCGRTTAGPHSNPGKWVNLGVAAHITAASPGGPRYEGTLTQEQRSDVSNGIWLCQSCAKLVDSDPAKYPAELLRQWKAQAEAKTERLMTEGQPPTGNGKQLAISSPLWVGMTPHAGIDGERVPVAPIDSLDNDPTVYACALVFRLLMRPAAPDQTVVVHGFGVDVVDVVPAQPWPIECAAYPTAISLYRLTFDDPNKARVKRFTATQFFEVKNGGGVERVVLPAPLASASPEVFDIRLSPRSPGLYSLRVFVMTSAGVQTAEQEVMPDLRVFVPPVEVYSPNIML